MAPASVCDRPLSSTNTSAVGSRAFGGSATPAPSTAEATRAAFAGVTIRTKAAAAAIARLRADIAPSLLWQLGMQLRPQRSYLPRRYRRGGGFRSVGDARRPREFARNGPCLG